MTINNSHAPANVGPGYITLRWTSTNATACELRQPSVATESVVLNETTGILKGPYAPSTPFTSTIELFCTGSGGTASDSVTFTVLPNPPNLIFLASGTASDKSVAYESTLTLSWNTFNTTSCSLRAGSTRTQALDSMVSLSTDLMKNGFDVGPMTTKTEFLLQCVDSTGTINAWRTITVDEPTHDIIFTTSTRHRGNFGGLSAADAICQARATAANLRADRTWKAVLSDNSTSALDRIPNTKPVYNVQLQRIDIQDGLFGSLALANPLIYDENGASATAITNNVWTGTLEDGESNINNNCGNWTSTAGTGRAALADSTTGWLSFGNGTCSALKHLYCISQ